MTTFTYTPDFPAEDRSRPRVRSYEADGFALRAEDGINLLTDKWPLTFSARNSTERTNLLSFFATQNGKLPFTWTTPFNETGQFVCTAWDLTLDSCNLTTISALFELVYVPGATNIPVTNVPTSAFTWLPDFTTSRSLDTKTRRLEFGEGYSQSVTIGIHAETEKWSLTLNNLTNARRDDIRAFLRGAARVASFAWQNPLGENGEYICEEWTTTYTKFNNSSIRAEFTRIYGTLAVTFNAYASGFSEVISYELAGGTAYASAPGFTVSVELEFTTSGTASTAAPGFNESVNAEFTGGVAYAPGGGPPSPGAGASGSFWSDWAYYDPDIFLYIQEEVADTGSTTSFWSHWKHYDTEIFLYEEGTPTAAETPAYWNRWQSWTEDPPLLFEESS
jgi:phage-related protein